MPAFCLQLVDILAEIMATVAVRVFVSVTWVTTWAPILRSVYPVCSLGSSVYCDKFITVHNRSCGKVMFLHMPVILFGGLHPLGRNPPLQDGHYSRQYASYWNAFSLLDFFTTRKRSCGKVMFSQVSVCPRGWGGYVFSDDHQVSLVGDWYV